MAILRSDGIPGLTMRRLAADMGVDPAAFYHHFRDKSAIIRAAGRAAVAEIDVPPEQDFESWRDWVIQVAHNYRAVLLMHPYLRALVINGDVRWTSLPVYTTERHHLTEEGIPEHLHHGLLQTLHCYILGSPMVDTNDKRDVVEGGATDWFELGLRVLIDGLVQKLRADPRNEARTVSSGQ
ncbi:TetR/AcrR family transcriptional regulator [Mycolicibacterium sp. ELW1]|uniref:TetR/AcrR family transcriptional regulator n=1 Tax=Mycobacteriaceae TaxID=1762 RepID=UPI00143DCCB0|nr:TetR/AcrR family transcriptional regulator [Mycobacterium sp. ELW1]